MALIPKDVRPEIAMTVAKNRKAYSNGLISFPSNLGAHSMLMVFTDYAYEKPGNRGLLSLNDNNTVLSSIRTAGITGIELPIPANLRDTDTLRVERFDQGYAGSEISAAAGEIMGAAPGQPGLGDLFKTVASGVTGILDSETIFNAIKTFDTSKLSRDAAFLLRSKLSGNVAKSIDAGLGSTINPKAALAFEGVELKQHSFNWTLAPKNANESNLIKGIIDRLKVKSLPQYQSFLNRSDKAYLQYPSVVDIYLLGVNAEYFMRFKPSMIRSVNTDYTSQGNLALVKGGKPAVVTLNIEFLEMDIHTANDYGISQATITENPALTGAAAKGA